MVQEQWPPQDLSFSLEAQPVAEGVFFVQGMSNAGWVITDEGVVVIDTTLRVSGPALLEEIRRTTDKPIRYIIYSHGHIDHVGGCQALAGEDTVVVAHTLVVDRLRKYEAMAPYNARINALQFHISVPEDAFRGFRYPDVTYHDRHSFSLGGRRFDLYHARGETDDATFVHIPDAGVVFAGDLLISVFPNVGNPFKVVRYEREWAEALEAILSLDPQVVCPGHGPAPYVGRGQIQEVLSHNAEALRFLHQEVVRRLNEGQPLDQMVAQIRLPAHLEKSPHLRQLYSRLEFAVINIWRRYSGWYDGDPADLIPQPRQELATILRSLVGDDGKFMAHAEALLAQGRPLLALALLQVLLRAAPHLREARALRARILERLFWEDECLMSRNLWHHFLDADRAFLEGGQAC